MTALVRLKEVNCRTATVLNIAITNRLKSSLARMAVLGSTGANGSSIGPVRLFVNNLRTMLLVK